MTKMKINKYIYAYVFLFQSKVFIFVNTNK